MSLDGLQFQYLCEHHVTGLAAMTDLGDSLPAVESLISDMQAFEAKSQVRPSSAIFSVIWISNRDDSCHG